MIKSAICVSCVLDVHLGSRLFIKQDWTYFNIYLKFYLAPSSKNLILNPFVLLHHWIHYEISRLIAVRDFQFGLGFFLITNFFCLHTIQIS